MSLNNCPLVSIIAVSYNHERFLKETLDSIRCQSYSNIELIVMDDASLDGSVEQIIYWKEEQKYQCEVIAHLQNKGFCATINEGLRIAGGKYVQIIACDDILTINKIKEQVEFLEVNSDCAAVCSNYQEIDENSNIIKDSNFKEDFIFPTDVFSTLLVGHKDYPIIVHSPTVLIRKSVYDTVGFYPEDIIQEDFYMWLKISERFKIGYIPECTVKYRILSTSLARNMVHQSRLIEDLFKVVSDFSINRPEYYSHYYKFQEVHLPLCKTYYISGEFNVDWYFNILSKYTYPDLADKYTYDKQVLDKLFIHSCRSNLSFFTIIDKYKISRLKFSKQFISFYFFKRRIKGFNHIIKRIIRKE